jgi:peptidoglycan/LPS O-acetylase OafA/YrhL
MAVCIPFAWLCLLPSEIKDFSQSLIAVTVFASNIFFYRETGYFDIPSELKPLLHTWSLAVEEQYYALFPVFLLVMWRFAKQWTTTTLVVIVVLSFALAQWGAYNKPAATFFLLPTRGWEIGIGALVAFFFSKYSEQKLHKSVKEIGGMMGLSLILYAVFAYSKSTPFPSAYALVPTLGTALVILCTTPSTFVGRILSTNTFVGIGLISYSAYLWHQPIFAFSRHVALFELSTSVYFSLVVFSFGLAFLSWRFVEKPFRSQARFGGKYILLLASVMAIFFVSIGSYGYLVGKDNLSFTWLDGETPRKWGGILKNGVNCSGRDPLETCVLGNGNAPLKVVIAGDSHARVLTQAAEYVSKNGQLELFDLSASGCPFMLGMSAYINGVISKSCNSEYQLKRMNFLATIPPAFVVLHSRFPLYLNGHGFDNTIGGKEIQDGYVMALTPHTRLDERSVQHKEALEKTINELLKLKHQVIIVSGVPTNGWDPIKRLKRLERLGLTGTHEARLRRMQIPLLAVNNESDLSDQMIREITQRYPNVRLIDPKTIFCDSLYCSSISKNKILYTDPDHLSFEGAMRVFNRVLLELDLNEGFLQP